MLYQVLKHQAQPSVLGLDTTRMASFVKYLKKTLLYICLFILILIFSLQVMLAKKIGRKI